MEKINTSFDYSRIENILITLDDDHSPSRLALLKSELNKLFFKAKCKDILYTMNSDKLFFGMRVYSCIDGDDAVEAIQEVKPVMFEKYIVEFDSKLFDPMLNLDEKELTAVLLHEIGHIVYDTGTLDEVKKNIDMYFSNEDDYLPNKLDDSYKELIAYALKDAIFKVGSMFTKIGDDEIIADTFVVSCGYGPSLETAFRKISRSSNYINKDVDDKLIVLSWVFRLKKDLKIKRIPAVKTLNKAKQLTGSELEKREIEYAVTKLNRLDSCVDEGAFENMKDRFSKKFNDFKVKGVRSIKNDVYELNLRLRTAVDEEDLIIVIRTANSDIAILQDYLTEPDIPEDERQSAQDALYELYSIRQKAAKEKSVKNRYDSVINVVYPAM